MQPVPSIRHRLTAIALLCLLPLALGCRDIGSSGELQALAGDSAPDRRVEAPAPSARTAAPATDTDLDDFPLVGSVFPGLGGRLHSSLCDPGSDPYSTCL
jgi:hypothetical protein